MNKSIRPLPVKWFHSKKAWMNDEIFASWLDSINIYFKSQNRKILLFIDNCSAQFKSEQKKLSNIKIIFYPANCTPVLQPLDQGIIRSFKVFYRRYLLQNIVDRIISSKNCQEFENSLNVLDACHWVK